LTVIFIESSDFSDLRESYLDDDEFGLLQAMLIDRPDAGDIIRGSGGVRKVRWTSRGTGKRGGLRVIYYWITKKDQILLLTLYKKGEVDDLAKDEIREMRKTVKSL
jgi:hypothetical protein